MPSPRRSQSSPRRPTRRATGASPRRAPVSKTESAKPKVVASPRETQKPDTLYAGRSLQAILKAYDSALSEKPDCYARVSLKGTVPNASFRIVVSMMRNHRKYVIVPELCLYGTREEVETFMQTFDRQGTILDESVLGSGDTMFPNHPDLEALYVTSRDDRSSRPSNVNARDSLELLLRTSSAIKKGSSSEIVPVTSSGKVYDKSQTTKKGKKTSQKNPDDQREKLINKYKEVIATKEGIIRVDNFDEKTLNGAIFQRSRISKMTACRQKDVSFYGYEDDLPVLRGPRDKIRLYIENVLSHDSSLQAPRELHTVQPLPSE